MLPPPQESTQADPPPPIGPGVTTHRNDNARTGVNSNETKLTLANVNVVNFGKLAAIPVEGDIYAQPLYVSNVTIGRSNVRNLVIVATEHDQVYAIDADTRAIVWHRDLLSPGATVTPVQATDVGCPDLAPEIGITGTPVIDPANSAIDLVARTRETIGGETRFYQRLHSLDLATGHDRLRATTIVTPDLNGIPGSPEFDPLLNNQRAALLLVNNRVYVSWASHCDLGGYRGWLMAFDQDSLQPNGAWAPDPTGAAGGIWMSGGGPSADDKGDIYVPVGNGTSDAMFGGPNYGDAMVRLRSSGQRISVLDYFIPFDYQSLLDDDLDLGAGSAVLLPTQPGARHPNLLVVASKGGMVYLLDRDNLGHWNLTDNSQIVQSFQNGGANALSMPAFWNNTLYFVWPFQAVQAFHYDPAMQQIDTTPVSSSGSIMIGYPGASPSISANGNQDAIVWMIQSDQFQTAGNAVLRAFDATNLANELYDSQMSPDRDGAGGAIKFTVPTIMDGQVFVGAHNELDIYGLLPH